MATAALVGLVGAKTASEYTTSIAQGEYQNSMSKINARMAELQGERTKKLGEQKAQRYTEQVNQLLGAQKAAYAAGGVDVSFGSARQVMEETRNLGLQDAQDIRTNAFLEALGYQAESQQWISKGEMARSAGYTSATQSLIGGGLQAAYYSGAFDKSAKKTT